MPNEEPMRGQSSAMGHIPGEGARLTLLKNQLAIMNTLRELTRSGRNDSLLAMRIRSTEEYLAEIDRRYPAFRSVREVEDGEEY